MHDELTDREREVLLWLGRGYTQQQTARRMRISRRTVQAHASHAYRKLGAQNVPHAVALLIRDGIVDVEEITTDVHRTE